MAEQTRGYLTICQQNSTTDYLRMAYALGLSLRGQSSVQKLSVLVDPEAEIPEKYKAVFDQIIPITDDYAKSAEWKIHNKWQAAILTPYTSTVLLDSDMLFFDDVSHWWDYMESNMMCITSKVHTYREEVVDSDFYRKVFTKNDLPNVYTAFMHFINHEHTWEVFEFVREIIKKWDMFVERYLWKCPPDRASGDVAFALAIKILGVESKFLANQKETFPTFVHMKSKAQRLSIGITEAWCGHITSEMHLDGSLYIGNYRQRLPFHYHRKEFLTDAVVDALEEAYG